MKDRKTTWWNVQRLAEHYRAIGHTDVYLTDVAIDDAPWQYVTEVTAGGSYRCGMLCGLHFVATLPGGIQVSWSSDIETSRSGEKNFDLDQIHAIRSQLSAANRVQMTTLLMDARNKLRDLEAEYNKMAGKLRTQIATIETLGAADGVA